jgi:uncharacterized protein
MRNLFTAALSALICTTATASTPKQHVFASAKTVRPGIWKLADADTTIYLFGTIHVLPKAYPWRTKRFNKIAAGADELVLEVADLNDPAKTAETFMRLAITPGLPPVLDRVPAAKRPGLSALITKSGLPAANLNQFESWAVAITLAAGMLSELNVSPDDGVERILTAQFEGAKKPISGLETSEYQLGIFDKLPAAAQTTFLAGMVDETEDPVKEFAAMLSAWSTGNDKAIALTFDDESKLSPELTEVLLRQRNANWTMWLKNRLDRPGTVLVAVGAGHLAGPDSVQAMLGTKGVKVSRVQ